MNNICKQYISEIKAFFPIIGKSERSYLAKLKTNIKNYCDETGITSKEELYKNYGLPNEVVSNYYSTVDTEYVIKKIRTSKHIRIFIVVLLALAVVATTAYCINLYSTNKIFTDQTAVLIEQMIE